MSNGVTAWSYSRYADYQQCPARFKFKYVDKLPDPGSPAMQRGHEIHEDAARLLQRVHPEPSSKLRSLKGWDQFEPLFQQVIEMGPQDATVLIEQQWGFTAQWTETTWFGKDVRLRSIADLALLYPDWTMDIVDHKTGRRYATNEEQVELFGLTALCRFPKLKSVTPRLWYLDDDSKQAEVICDPVRVEDRESLIDKWDAKVRPMFLDTGFAARPNEKCGQCVFAKNKGGPCKF